MLEGLVGVGLAFAAAAVGLVAMFALLAAVLGVLAGAAVAVQTFVAIMAVPLPDRWRAWLVEHRIATRIDRFG